MDAKATDAENHDTMMALGRVLYDALDGTSLRPDMRVRDNVLTDSEGPQAYIVLEKENTARQWLKPPEMEVLCDFGISAEPVDRDHWKHARYAEFRVQIPDDVLEAYEQAVDELGVPPAPRKWDSQDQRNWKHEALMNHFGPAGEA